MFYVTAFGLVGCILFHLFSLILSFFTQLISQNLVSFSAPGGSALPVDMYSPGDPKILWLEIDHNMFSQKVDPSIVPGCFVVLTPVWESTTCHCGCNPCHSEKLICRLRVQVSPPFSCRGALMAHMRQVLAEQCDFDLRKLNIWMWVKTLYPWWTPK